MVFAGRTDLIEIWWDNVIDLYDFKTNKKLTNSLSVNICILLLIIYPMHLFSLRMPIKPIRFNVRVSRILSTFSKFIMDHSEKKNRSDSSSVSKKGYVAIVTTL